MTDKKTKTDAASPFRTPKPKKKLGLKVPTIRMPHEDLIKPEFQKLGIVENKTGTTGTTNETGTTGTINTTGTTGTTRQAVSPEKNFTKTPNSVVKVILAQGLFRGKSKQIYDYLWLVSRGSVNPVRRVRKTFNDIQKGSGLGSRNTVLSGIAHLESIGLIIREKAVGESEGNTYEVFTPEELGIGSTSSTNFSGTTGTTETTQKVVVPVVPLFGTTGTIQTPESIEDSEPLRLSLKTNTNDDEAFAGFIEIFNQLNVELTGKRTSAADRSKLQNLAELLALELRTAARHTDSISSPAAFLTEHLRRRLLTGPILKNSKVKIDTVGKSEPDSYEIKPLDEKGREAALAQLREFVGDDFLQDFKKWYTPEDWNWLMKELEKK